MNCTNFSDILDREDENILNFFDFQKTKVIKQELIDQLSIFVSFDICNSTRLKSEISNWSDVIQIFYGKNDLSYLRKWKYVGDEVIYVGDYSGFKQLIELIEAIYLKMDAIEKDLQKTIKSVSNTTSLPSIKLKGTIWLAQLSNKVDMPKTTHIDELDEYVGMDMDEGFRMSTKTSEGKLLIDPKIVYIILFFYCFRSVFLGIDVAVKKDFVDVFVSNHIDFTNENKNDIAKKVFNLYDGDLSIAPIEHTHTLNRVLSKIHFLSFTPLKGIWNGNPYPIFWYFDDAASCKYYEIERTDLFPVSLSNIIKQSDNTRMYYSSRDLLKVFETVGLAGSIKNIINTILFPKTLQKISYVKKPVSKFYYTIACVKDNKVLLLRRKADRRHLGNVWEFFVSKHTNITTKTEIESAANRAFGINIDLLTDNTEDKNIIPLHFCTVYRTQKKHNSILCCAEIQDDLPIETLMQKINKHLLDDVDSKYSEAVFIGIDEIMSSEFKFNPLPSNVISYDAEKADTDESYPFKEEHNYSTMYLKDSIKAVICFYKKYKKLHTEGCYDWWKIFK